MSTQVEKRTVPWKRNGKTFDFTVNDPRGGKLRGYVICGEFEDGSLAEIFLYVAKQGSTISGLLDTWAITFSGALQFGAPLSWFVLKLVGLRFEPHGDCDDLELNKVSSVTDYIIRRLALDYLSTEEQQEVEELLGFSLHNGATLEGEWTHVDAPECRCGTQMRLVGDFWACPKDGETVPR